MQTKKMSLANIQGKLSRAEMKNIMAGSDYTPTWFGSCQGWQTNNCFYAGQICGNGGSYCRLDTSTGQTCCIHG